MLNRNATNSTTIIVTPLDTDAGNINNTLLPASIPIIATIGLLCCIIAWITGFYTLRNAASSSNNFFNLLSTSTNRIIFYQQYSSSTASFCATAACVSFRAFFNIADRICKNTCYSMLAKRNLILLALTLNIGLVISRLYILPATLLL
jgi:hypothetical protein